MNHEESLLSIKHRNLIKEILEKAQGEFSHGQSDKIRLNVILFPNGHKFVSVAEKKKSIRELVSQMKADASDFLRQIGELSKGTKK